MKKNQRPDIEFTRLEDIASTAKHCEEQVENYKSWADKLEEDSLKEEEKILIDIINKYEDVLKEKTYSLGSKVEFGGRIYSKDKVFKFIQEIINKREASYQETLGLYQLYQYWGEGKDTVSYPILDSTLRTLESTPKFKGMTEWEKILVINEYFKINNEEMSMDYLQQIYYAHLHNVLIDKLQINTPVENQEAKEGPIQMD